MAKKLAPFSALQKAKDYIDNMLSGKVDKVSGKGLSTNDYTTTEKNKLSGIASGAEVNVQSDWNQSTTTADDYIKNKPTNMDVLKRAVNYENTGGNHKLYRIFKVKYTSYNFLYLKFNYYGGYTTSGSCDVVIRFQPNGVIASNSLIRCYLINEYSHIYAKITNDNGVEFYIESMGSGDVGVEITHISSEANSINNVNNSNLWWFPSTLDSYDLDYITTSDITVYNMDDYNSLSNTPSSLPASDVYPWAKAATKPSYTASEVGLGNVGNFKAVSTVANQGLSTTEKQNAITNIDALPKWCDLYNGYIKRSDGSGQWNYYKIATIKITTAYVNYPLVLEISGRGILYTTLQIMYNSSDTTDPGLDYFRSDCDNRFYIKKTDTSTWDIFGAYSQSWGNAALHKVTGTIPEGIQFAIGMTSAGSIPSGAIQATYWGNVETAEALRIVNQGSGPITSEIVLNNISTYSQKGITYHGVNIANYNIMSNVPANGFILTIPWAYDGRSGTWFRQFFVDDNDNTPICVRYYSSSSRTFGAWKALAYTDDIPTVNNATLTIQRNGTNVQTFTSNQSTNATANISVPTKVSELTNDSGYTTNTGTVTGVKVGNTSYSPTSGVVSIPAYPTTLPASDVYAWAKASTKPSYSASEVGLGNVGNFKAVSTVANQGLSDTEKANARTNIGAASDALATTSVKGLMSPDDKNTLNVLSARLKIRVITAQNSYNSSTGKSTVTFTLNPNNLDGYGKFYRVSSMDSTGFGCMFTFHCFAGGLNIASDKLTPNCTMTTSGNPSTGLTVTLVSTEGVGYSGQFRVKVETINY